MGGPARSTIVLDTAALLAGLGPAQGSGGPPVRWVMPPAVQDEVQPGGPTGRALERALSAGLQVVAPAEAAQARVAEAVAERGETTRLSKADQEVLALALDAQQEGSVEIWTDDYSIQNIARALHLPTKPILTAGIREEVTWHVRCTGCGQYPKEATGETCLICGSALKRTRRPPGAARRRR